MVSFHYSNLNIHISKMSSQIYLGEDMVYPQLISKLNIHILSLKCHLKYTWEKISFSTINFQIKYPYLIPKISSQIYLREDMVFPN